VTINLSKFPVVISLINSMKYVLQNDIIESSTMSKNNHVNEHLNETF